MNEPVRGRERPLVDLVIVDFRSCEEVVRCLAALEPARHEFGRVTIVDHDSETIGNIRAPLAARITRLLGRGQPFPFDRERSRSRGHQPDADGDVRRA